jgi:hypothetical protein
MATVLVATALVGLAVAPLVVAGTVSSVAAAVAVPAADRVATAALAGIVPPDNPPRNIPPNPYFYEFCGGGALDETVACNSEVVLAIDHARSGEPLAPLHFNLQRFLRLPVADQLFAIADLERVSRGEQPMSALTTQLDEVAGAGALAGKDPEPSAERLSGGARLSGWGSNWAEGTDSALGSDDMWMYDDGYGGANFDCRSAHAEGCWGHRDNILRAWQHSLAGCTSAASHLVMGAGYARSSRFGASFAEIFVAACGPKPAGEVFTWPQARAAIGF